MTIRSTEGDDIPTDVVAFTEELFLLAIADVRAAMAAITADQTADQKGSVPKSRDAIRDLAKVGLMLIEERAKFEKLSKQIAGSVGAGCDLDLGAARDEIGRRMACLRAARGD